MILNDNSITPQGVVLICDTDPTTPRLRPYDPTTLHLRPYDPIHDPTTLSTTLRP